MALELAEAAAAFPLAASFAIAGGITAVREGRRRAALNEAVHELRRPLQGLALSLPADPASSGSLNSSLQLAVAAIDRLESEINGGGPPSFTASICLRPVVEAAVARWRGPAAHTQRSLNLSWRANDPFLQGNEVELSRAVDNMISNAFEHGTGEVTVEVRENGDSLCLAVLDSGSPASPSPTLKWSDLRARVSGRSRHGHGLKIARRAAGQHGGSFQLRRSPQGAEARLELPLAGGVR
jgi:signal transduction histidine kinase